jgi:outer membrane protein OmpA-like peptidoglycan-associated protein
MTTNIGFLKVTLIAILFILSDNGLAQNELRDAFFKDADIAKATAEAANAKLFAPNNFQRGMKEYGDAEELLERGRNIDYVRSNASDAIKYFKTAVRAAKFAKTTLAQAIKSRQDGANVGAPKRSPHIWNSAQQKFIRAVQLLERGDLEKAKQLEGEAIILYRDAELASIKEQYLGETQRLLSDADKARIGRYTPIILKKAKSLIAKAESELNKNRYEIDQPKSLVKQANYEIKHALYLSEIVRQVGDKDLTVEQLLLNWEQNMWTISDVAGIVPNMGEGHNELTTKLVAHFKLQNNEQQDLKQKLEKLEQELKVLEQEKTENTVRINDMDEELRALDQQLIDASSDRATLIQRLEAQARVKEQFEQVEKMFSPQEARVFREADTIILRLFSLNFDSGASRIKPENFDLLSKAEKAINIFPQSELIINGHTDSQGNDDLNQRISQERAESVKQFMINEMKIPIHRLIASGYGETQPVSSNDTEAGRARNRRIDIVISPSIEIIE